MTNQDLKKKKVNCSTPKSVARGAALGHSGMKVAPAAPPQNQTKKGVKNPADFSLPEGWVETTLGEVVELVGGGTPKTTVSEYWGGDIPWLSVVDFNNNLRWVLKTEKTITKKGLDNSSTKILEKGDLIISARGTVGALAQLKKEMAFNQSCYGIKEMKNISDKDFLYYLIKYSLQQINRNVHGAVFDTITRDTFDTIKINLPPLPQQKVIAKVLSSFDDKIELLREENETLEKIGQEIFKEWFGKYKVGDDLPNGWRVGKLGEVVNIKQGKYIKTEEISDFITNNKKYPIYGGNGIRGYIDDFTYKEPEVILTCRGNGCGRLFYSDSLSSITNSCMTFESEKSILSSEFIYFWAKRFNFEAVTSGSAQPQITVSNLYNIEIITPEKNILEKFNKIVKPLFEKIKNNSDEIQTLSKTRDTLLPKLMKGEIILSEK